MSHLEIVHRLLRELDIFVELVLQLHKRLCAESQGVKDTKHILYKPDMASGACLVSVTSRKGQSTEG
jgi:hypothetical protein